MQPNYPGPGYAPPGQYAPQRPGAPKVLGVLSIVFGSLILLMGLLGSCSLVVAGMPSAMMEYGGEPPPGSEGMIAFMETFYLAYGAMSAALAAMSGWLLGVGVGQLKYRAWAANGSIVWGIVALAVLAGMVLISLLVIGPAYEGLLANIETHGGYGPELGSGFSMAVGGTFAIMTTLFYAPYPIILIAVFRSQRIRGAMTN